jgi:hypothetical protein
MEKVRALKVLETSILHVITMFRTLNFVVSFCVPMIVALACFGTYYLYSGVVSVLAVTSFTVLSISNSLRYPLFLLPTSTKAVSGTFACPCRVVFSFR